MKKLLIIPAYNEAKNLSDLINEIKMTAPDYDYVIINDGSRDNTVDVCIKNHLNALHLASNLGIGGAVQTGYKYALRNGYDIAIQIDGDGQHDPSYLNKLVDPIIKGNADYCIGSRFIQFEGFQSSHIRRLGIRWLNFILFILTGQRFSDATSGFRAVNRAVFKNFAESYPYDYPEPETICDAHRQGLKIVEVPVKMRERSTGVSSIRPWKSIYYMVKVTLAILVSRIKSR